MRRAVDRVDRLAIAPSLVDPSPHRSLLTSCCSSSAVQVADDLLDALARARSAGSSWNVQPGQVLHPHLLAERRSQVRTRRAQRLRGRLVLLARGRARNSRRSPARRSPVTSTPVIVTKPRRGSDSRSSSSASVSRTTSFTRADARVLAPRAGPPLGIVSPPARGSAVVDVEQLDVGRAGDEPLDRVEHVVEVAVALGDHRDRDRRPAATGPGGRPRRPTGGTGGAACRRSGGRRRASPSATGSRGRGGRSRPRRRARSHCASGLSGPARADPGPPGPDSRGSTAGRPRPSAWAGPEAPVRRARSRRSSGR